MEQSFGCSYKKHMSMGKTISNTIGIGSGRKARSRHIPYYNQDVKFETADPAALKVKTR